MPSPLMPGESAPAFTLTDKDGVPVSLKSLKSEYSIVFFYPKDSTPGCTIEAKSLSKDLAAFEKLGVSVIGISGGDDKSKAKFCKKEKLTVTLLSDTDFSIAKKFGVYGKKSFMGKEFMGIMRTTFLIDNKQKVVKTYAKVSPETHSTELLADLKKLKTETTKAKKVVKKATAAGKSSPAKKIVASKSKKKK